MWIAFIIAIVTSATFYMIIRRQKEYEFSLWIADFERLLGAVVPEHDRTEILRDLFSNSDISIKYAVEIYKEIKHGN